MMADPGAGELAATRLQTRPGLTRATDSDSDLGPTRRPGPGLFDSGDSKHWPGPRARLRLHLDRFHATKY